MIVADFLVFTVASSFGYMGILMLIFGLFKIEYRWYIPHMVFVCAFLSYISFTMRMASMSFYAPTAQIIALIVIMWLLFRFPLSYAAVMTIIGYLLSGIIDYAWAMIFLLLGYEILPFSAVMYIGSIVAGSTNILIGGWIYRQRWGFSFIRSDEAVRRHVRETNSFVWICVTVFSIFGFLVVYVFSLVWFTPLSLLLVMVQLSGASGVLIYLLYRREKQEYMRRKEDWAKR